MIANICSCALVGIDGHIIDVEVDISNGLPSHAIVGLPDIAVKESRERVFSALKNNGFKYPMKKITINLAPAHLKKEGPAYDLSIAIGILIASEQIVANFNKYDYVFLGELSLKGEIRPITGILPMTLAAKNNKIKNIVVPEKNAPEAALVQGINVIPAKHINQVIEHLIGVQKIYPYKTNIEKFLNQNKDHNIDFSEVKGQESVKRALEVSAAGAHNILLIGPPGAGKTMLARRFPTILPNMTIEEALEVTKIYSVSGLLKNNIPLVNQRPFRSPHHTISRIALIGGGRVPKPGEVSLAHLGVLFLDELPEFQKSALEVLRQPLEDKNVTISRVNASLNYPASFMMVSSMNPCPCGYYGDEDHQCTCTPHQIHKYLNKISGPLLDRIDIHIEVNSAKYENLKDSDTLTESSSDIQYRVNQAREIQLKRFSGTKTLFNSQLTPKQIQKYCKLGESEEKLMEEAFNKLNLSARAYHRILKLSRTIADLDKSEKIELEHLSEAIQYRSLDRKYWEIY